MSNCQVSEGGDEKAERRADVRRAASNASRKESFRRRNAGPAKIERTNVDDRFIVDDNREGSIIFKKHLLEALDYDPVSVKNIVMTELRDIRIELEMGGGRQSRSKTRKASSATPSNAIQLSVGGEQFLETIELKLEGGMPVRLCIPSIVKQCCEYIREEINTEGIFRKSGLTSRVSSLKQRFSEKVEDVFNAEDTVFDATSVLKQYFRELSSPLIPFDTHLSFLKCLECDDEKNRVEAVLTCVFLLPLVNIHVLAYLMSFLHEVTDHCVQNKMGHKNIALVMTPNIMPLEEKKHISKGKETIISEKMALEKNRKVVEILILYGDRVGWVPSRMFRALEVQFIYRNSDDELENDRGGREGRRKKRRSGSLTRMFGFFRKVTKGGDTPSSVIDTPSSYAHTPILKASTKKRGSDEPMFSTQKKKTILDAVRKTGLSAGCNSPNGFLACPSPAICLNPSPMKADWSVQTPDSFFATPCINRDKKRSKSTPETLKLLPQSSNKASTKNVRLGFGRKSGKKVAMLHQQVQQNLLKANHEASTVSIHQLPQSPRKRGTSNDTADILPALPTDVEIPPPPEFSDPPDIVANNLTKQEKSLGKCSAHTSVDEGEYVTIAADACTCDVRNEAFIASSMSLDVTDNEGGETSDNLATSAENKAMDIEMLRLTPLIKEINNLTMNAQHENFVQLPRTTPTDSVDASTPLAERSNLPERVRTPRSGSKPATTLDEVAKEFRRAINEEKLIKLKAEIAAGDAGSGRVNGVQRRGSVHVPVRGVSPSKRRINSFRRRSYDASKPPVGPAQSPRFMSLRSPRSRPVPPPPLVRSPSRCTLRRGRPNTAWAGLPKPSPARGSGNSRVETTKRSASNSATSVKSQRSLTQVVQQGQSLSTKTTRSPVIRRMSSVQELVHRLERKGKISKSAVEVVPDTRRPQRPSTLNLGNNRRSLPTRSSSRVSEIGMPSTTVLKMIDAKPPTPRSTASPKNLTPNQGNGWTSGAQFDFGKTTSPLVTTPVVGNRESIHFLKTKNAGKVSANIKMFDGIAKQEPSGSRIPRYTALHTIPSQRCLLASTDE